jgi:hypothetical protein
MAGPQKPQFSAQEEKRASDSIPASVTHQKDVCSMTRRGLITLIKADEGESRQMKVNEHK